MTVPMYLAECAPVHMRGRLTVADNMAITGGQFAAGIIDYSFSYVDQGWRYVWEFACACVCVWMCACVYVHVFMCVCACVYVHACMCMCSCVYVHVRGL